MNNQKLAQSIEYGVFWGPQLFEGLGPKDPVIENLLYRNDIICISAESGVGKSIFVLQMLAALTSGKPFLDAFKVTRPSNVLYFQTEGDRVETIDRLAHMAKGVSIDHDKWVHINLDGISLNTSAGYNQFMELATKPDIQYDVIILDPLYTTVKGSLISDEVVTDWVRYIRKIRAEFGCSIIIVNHEGKASIVEGKMMPKGLKDVFGSTFWVAHVNYNFKLKVDRNGLFTLESGKERTRHVVDKLEMRMIEPEPLMFVLADTDTSLKEIQITKLLGEAERPLFIREIIRSTESSRATVYRILNKLLDSGKVRKIGNNSSFRYTIKH